MLPADCAVDDLGNSYVTGQAGSTSTFVFGTTLSTEGTFSSQNAIRMETSSGCCAMVPMLAV
jgi:hypothetical protein